MLNRFNLGRVRSAGALVVGLLCALGSGQVDATIIKIFGPAALYARADVIAEVQVGSARTLRAGPNQFIYTDSRVRLRDVWFARGAALKLNQGATLNLRQIGGRLGDVEQSVIGTAPIKVGDRLVVFARYQDGRLYLVGMGQGAFLELNESSNPPVRNMFGARPKASAVSGKQEGSREELRSTVRRLAEQARGPK